MKKIQTTYELTKNIQLVQNEEFKEHISLIEYGEPCSGILKHWGSKTEILRELNEIIAKLEAYNYPLIRVKMPKRGSKIKNMEYENLVTLTEIETGKVIEQMIIKGVKKITDFNLSEVKAFYKYLAINSPSK